MDIKKIAILSGSTIGEIKNLLKSKLLGYDISAEIYIGEYNRFYENGVFGDEKLRSFNPDIIYIHTTNKNLLNLPSMNDSQDEYQKKLIDEFERFKQVWDTLRRDYTCSIILNNFEPLHYRLMGNADCYRENGRGRFISELNALLYGYTNSHDKFYVNDIGYLASSIGILHWFDPAMWYLYKYAMSFDGMNVLCDSLAHIIKSLFGRNKKALILDLDNTLWGGIIGDDGIEKIELGEEKPSGRAYSDFQSYLKELSKLGIVLNVASKNEEAIAKSGFQHPASVLKEDDFISFKANWDGKDKNISKIADELNITRQGFVFVDDNPAERELVRQSIPEVVTLAITAPENYLIELDRQAFFEVTSTTKDDFLRNKYYKENLVRQDAEKSFSNYGGYLLSLQMVSKIEPFQEKDIERVTQLFNKTNQFNFTTIRFSQSEIESFRKKTDEYITIQATLVDKFGDNGLVSALICEIKGKNAKIINWIMSCRVFKRNLEHAIFDYLIHECKKREIDIVIGEYIKTAKNSMLSEFYEHEFGFIESERNENKVIWKYIVPDKYELSNKAITLIK